VDKDASKVPPHLKSLLEGNQKWVESMKSEDPEFFTKLAKPQTPKYLYFGCADSRVPANQILGKG
jgi:carbonic anhydrase